MKPAEKQLFGCQRSYMDRRKISLGLQSRSHRIEPSCSQNSSSNREGRSLNTRTRRAGGDNSCCPESATLFPAMRTKSLGQPGWQLTACCRYLKIKRFVCFTFFHPPVQCLHSPVPPRHCCGYLHPSIAPKSCHDTGNVTSLTPFLLSDPAGESGCCYVNCFNLTNHCTYRM